MFKINWRLSYYNRLGTTAKDWP